MSQPPPAPPVVEIVIEPTHGARAFAWREIWAYRDLLSLLVWRDYASRYKQTVLGPLWFIIQPLLTTIVFTIVFGKFAGIATPGSPSVLFYMCGLLAWNYFSQTFQSSSSTLVNNAGMFGKVYFPRLIVPLAAIVSNLATLAIQGATFAVIYVVFHFVGLPSTTFVRWEVLLLPLVVLQIAALGLGTGLWLAALTARYRDFTVLAGFLLQLWLYATPVIYPLQNVPAEWRVWVAINPMSMPVESFRLMLLGTGSPSTSLFAVSLGVTALLLLTGLLAFRRVESTFVDVI